MPGRFVWGLCVSLGVVSWMGVPLAARGAEGQAEAEAMTIGVGWRGDGSGRYPQAAPPVHWGRVGKTVAQLRAQAAKPKDGDTGTAIPDGVIREWLVLGPLPLSKAAKPNADVIAGESDWSPSEGEKVGDLVWRKVPVDSSTLDLKALFGATAPVEAVGYALAYVYSEMAQPFAARTMVSSESSLRTLCNGKIWDGKLEKGWNRLLFRVGCGRMDCWQQDKFANWYLRLIFFADKGDQYEERNIAWTVRLPGWGIAQPVIVGDRLLVSGNNRTLFCLNKQDGRILWARTTTYADVATQEERKASPEAFAEIDPLCQQLRKIDASLGESAQIEEKVSWEKIDLEHKIVGLMAKVNPEKYKRLADGEAGSAIPVPTSDGRYVYTLWQDLLVCFDLNGQRQWIYHYSGLDTKSESHGYVSSPRVVAGKVVAHFDNPASPRTVAVDAATGKVAWMFPAEDVSEADAKRYAGKGHGHLSSLQGMMIGGQPLVVTPLALLYPADGRVAAYLGDYDPGVGGFYATPIIYDGTLVRYPACSSPGRTKLGFVTLPAAVGATAPAPASGPATAPGAVPTLEIDTTRFPRFHGGWFIASPLYHEGLLYIVTEGGVLTVIDAAARSVVYQKLLDADLNMAHTGDPSRGGCGSSPTLAGKYIYIFGNRGTCLVIEPGRQYRQVAKNRLERIAGKTNAAWGGTGSGQPESTMSCPTFEGGRLYYRALQHLYCIEEKE
jgi:hypothetical protein